MTEIETAPTLLALDFDGVLCNGLMEYFQTAWRVYCQIWSHPEAVLPEGLAEEFNRLRPVVETGWEMPVVIQAILSGVSEIEILANWAAIAPQLAKATGLSPTEIGNQVDHTRDRWIANDLESWLALHQFYPGVIERLQQISSLHPVIITTKEERFVVQLLQQQGIDFPQSQIFGKSLKQPKSQTLRALIQDLSQQNLSQQTEHLRIWFVEDRLKTLQAITVQPDLSPVRLFLGDWGYNTASDREAARQDPRIHLLSLSTFAGEFSLWI
ncbi:MAG: HAD family hydrolase [Timaviella obliquedivisa GSE-PSE-MK23-08B]|jgi:phosphoglycolate phosphatase-like HAD superfamily hydrolase|nr:HAD family hydrolase [Timaviella obliquedivisa GSE-PSE-MK23-08B]